MRFIPPLLAAPSVRKVSLFAVVGALSGLIYLAGLLLATRLLAIRPEVASLLAYAIALPFNFLGHRHLAFASRNHWRGDAARYLASILLSLAASYGIVWLVSSHLGFPPVMGGIASILCIPIISYILMNNFVFKLWPASPNDRGNHG
jgi:putative flippase GtrA